MKNFLNRTTPFLIGGTDIPAMGLLEDKYYKKMKSYLKNMLRV